MHWRSTRTVTRRPWLLARGNVTAMLRADSEMCDHAVDLCQRLIRIDTTNPPGNEREAAHLLATEFSAAGLDPKVLESAPGRANVVVRHKGTGAKPPLLLTAHLDVVEADASQWRYPPFSGVIAEGCLWGRGAIDMKNHAAMSVALVTRLARENIRLDRDITRLRGLEVRPGFEYAFSPHWAAAAGYVQYQRYPAPLRTLRGPFQDILHRNQFGKINFAGRLRNEELFFENTALLVRTRVLAGIRIPIGESPWEFAFSDEIFINLKLCANT